MMIMKLFMLKFSVKSMVTWHSQKENHLTCERLHSFSANTHNTNYSQSAIICLNPRIPVPILGQEKHPIVHHIESRIHKSIFICIYICIHINLTLYIIHQVCPTYLCFLMNQNFVRLPWLSFSHDNISSNNQK